MQGVIYSANILQEESGSNKERQRKSTSKQKSCYGQEEEICQLSWLVTLHRFLWTFWFQTGLPFDPEAFVSPPADPNPTNP